MRERKCFGYPDGKVCPNKPGTPWSPYWCPSCNELRLAGITASLNKIRDDLKRSSESTNGGRA